ncbi:helix-turn-helix domain-containing protein [Paraburkholderia bannensis]|uniref:hypothetical protein n=1 Tax=Paraburkholderia bannensis TaxID=765414 RepID=UPI002AB7C718|nr:hypothetical protein [Paraburkholderia bannensis]
MDAQAPREMLTAIKAKTGLSEVALARKLHVSQPTVNRILKSQDGCSSATLLAIQGLYAEVLSQPAAG